jgi:outer membrane receptor protein involved in Fe transport
MGISKMKRSTRRRVAQVRLPVGTSVSAAVLVALYGMPQLAVAQQQPAAPQQSPSSSSAELGEITVTATRREVTLESVPYSLSVVSGEDLARNGVTDIASLANEVPGLAYYDFGARQSGAEVPIIRGLNASDNSVQGRSFRTFEQSPVGTYIGNSPFDGYLQLDDIQRVEVLRGPQGTLYGAGSLGGALRIIPNAPQLGAFSGGIEASGGYLQGAGKAAYTTSAVLNVPMGDTLAFRAAAKFGYQPGYDDVYGLLKRTGSPLTGIPVLADPGDPVNSPGVFYGKHDWNDQNSFTGRVSLLWKPTDDFNANLAFIYANTNGDGGPWANPSYPGGAYPIDPRISFPAGNDHQTYSAVDQQFWRRTTLSSIDLSYDAGFATLSSTSTYSTTSGSTISDGTYIIGNIALGDTQNYYGGVPLNPRFIQPGVFNDNAHTFDQEIRLVSKTGPDTPVDYVVGLFYEDQTRVGGWFNPNPGSPERAVAQGCSAPYYYGASFPNCLLSTGPGDENFVQVDTQNFTDKSEFGELTYHFTSQGQITAGFRHFEQQFTDAQSYLVYTYGILIPATPHSAPASKNTWKVNPSYEYAPGQYVYAIWSQGFRRGGANSVPPVGLYKESPQLASYAPDSVNNYEAGLKGRFDSGFSYTFSIFDIHWDKPQISSTLPDGNLAVYNANTALSKGIEFEAKGPLFLPGLTYSIGGAYADATLTSSFSLPANNGTGVIQPGLISGSAGDALPGSPKISGSLTFSYARTLVPGYDLNTSLNGTYRSTVPLFLTPPNSQYHSQAYGLANLSATVVHNPWHTGLYVTNLFDKRADLSPFVPNVFTNGGGLIQNNVYNLPREIGIKIGYSF